jgi:glycosyltransferase involved in cell wall biosynthesis
MMSIPALAKAILRPFLSLDQRIALAQAFYRATAPKPCDLADCGKGPPIVVGFLRTPSGIGASGRMALDALRQLGYPAQAYDLSRLFQPDNLLDVDLGPEADFSHAGPIILHTNPPEMMKALSHLGKVRLKNRLITALWAWELPKMRPDWIPAFDYVHEVWSPSLFCTDAFQAETKMPVRTVLHPAQPYPLPPADKAAFGIPKDSFVCLTMADMRSSLARKNPIGAIQAFKTAFGTDMSRRLLVKIGYADTNPAAMQELMAAIGDAPNIHPLTQKLEAPDYHLLLSSIDCFLSLHRSEGYGLVIAEAMQAGKPVIATGWSGNLDFCPKEAVALVPFHLVPVNDPQNIYGGTLQYWAEPDVSFAAATLRNLANTPALAAELGARGKQAITQATRLTTYEQSMGPVFQKCAIRNDGQIQTRPQSLTSAPARSHARHT